MELSDLSADKLVEVYVKISNRRAVLKQNYKEEDATLKKQEDLVANAIKELCHSIGANSINTDHGTASLTTKTRYWTSDWNSMYNFIQEHNAFHLLEQRLAQVNLVTFMNENPDLLPPGLNSNNQLTISVRKAK
jgi:hypothetical protein